jgi:hypothetical protein
MMIKIILWGFILTKLTVAQDLPTEITDPTVKLTIELAKSWRYTHPYQDFTIIPIPNKKGYLRATLKSSKDVLNYKEARTSENVLTVDQAKQIYIYFRDENYPNMILPQQTNIANIFDQAQLKAWSYWCSIL